MRRSALCRHESTYCGTVRRLVNCLGFDDGPFCHEHRGDVPLVGVLCARTRVDGVLLGKVRRDGANATHCMTALVQSSAFSPQAILLQGIAVGGFNVVDVRQLHDALGVPVLVVMASGTESGSNQACAAHQGAWWSAQVAADRAARPAGASRGRVRPTRGPRSVGRTTPVASHPLARPSARAAACGALDCWSAWTWGQQRTCVSCAHTARTLWSQLP